MDFNFSFKCVCGHASHPCIRSILYAKWFLHDGFSIVPLVMARPQGGSPKGGDGQLISSKNGVMSHTVLG